MAYDRYQPQERSNRPMERSNQPQSVTEQAEYYSAQPASRTRFYRDKQNGKVMGVCAGLADATGLDATLVRLGALLSLLVLGPAAVLLYLVAGWIAPERG
jgi:phage shock protein C